MSLSVCLLIRTSLKNYMSKIHSGGGSVSSDDNAIRNVYPVLWMTSYLPIISHAKATPLGRILEVTHQGAEPGLVCCLQLPCLTMWPLTLKSKNITRWQRYVHRCICPSVRQSHADFVSKRLNLSSSNQHHRANYGLPVFSCHRFWWQHSTHCTACMSSRCWVMTTHITRAGFTKA